MATLHYGTDLQIPLDKSEVKQLMEAIGAHATRGGWVTIDTGAGKRSFLVTAGSPIWIDEDT